MVVKVCLPFWPMYPMVPSSEGFHAPAPVGVARSRKSEDCMNVKVVISWALVVAALSTGMTRGQDLPRPSYVTPIVPAPSEAPVAAAPAPAPAVHSLSDWI